MGLVGGTRGSRPSIILFDSCIATRIHGQQMEKDTLQVPHPTLVSAITSNVKTKPNKVFLKWVSSKNEIQQTRTYSEVYEQSLRVVHLLQRKGVKRGDRVMIAYPFGLEFVSGLVGCMMAGVIACSVSDL